MASPQLDAPTPSPAPLTLAPRVRRPAASPARPAPVCGQGVAGPARQPVGPVDGRRGRLRPGVRAAGLDRTVSERATRGVCAGGSRPAVRVPRREAAAHPVTPLRLTARGRRVVAGLSMAIGLSIAAGAVVTIELNRGGGLQLAGSETVVVRAGDTLWSIAGDVAPGEDRRAVVDAIVELNGLDSVDLLPGAELQLP